MLQRVLRSYGTWVWIEYPCLHSSKGSLRYIKMITWFLFPNILTQRKLFVLFGTSCLWKMNIFCYFRKTSLLREGIFAKNWDLCFFFFQVLCKWIPLSFALRCHSRKQIPHKVAKSPLVNYFLSRKFELHQILKPYQFVVHFISNLEEALNWLQ